MKNFSKSILGFLFYGKISKSELSYAWRRGLIPEHKDLSICAYFFPYIKTFVDVGANTGIYCLSAANYRELNVFAFEPQEDCVQDLLKTKKLNNWTNLVIENYAVSNSESSLKLYRDECSTGTSYVPNGNNYITAKTVGLDNYFKDTKIDFIKIDVEGFEFEVLKSSFNIIKIHKPIIFLELLEKTDNKKESIKLLIEKGYKLFYYNDKLNRIEEFTGTPFETINMYLCLHAKDLYHINSLNEIISKNRLMFLPFKYSKLSFWSKYLNYYFLLIRYSFRSLVK